MPRMRELLYGTSSWSEKSWVGPFYPEGTQPRDFLPYYAKEFRVVEADTTYYGIPRPSTVAGWREKTPDGFEMAAKFPRSIVHGGEGPRPDRDVVLVPERVDDETREFLDVMSGLGDRCGPLVLQFPYFSRDVFPKPGEFLERLDVYLGRLPREFRYAVEVRNQWWIKNPLVHILKRHGVALVLVEMARMPHPADLAVDLVTADFVYARLIGDRKAVDKRTKTFDRLVLDRTPSLERWAGVLRDLLERVEKAYVFANNHYAGHGPATIRALADLVGPNDAVS
jgi:uncharacterized protein YecE (DUF72 family)